MEGARRRARPEGVTVSERSILVVAHTGRPESLGAAVDVIGLLTAAGVHAVVDPESLDDLRAATDGAALRGADLAATGLEIYDQGVEGERLEVSHAQASRSVADYIRSSGAYADYPGLTYVVRVDPVQRSVQVALRAPLDLPLTFPGAPERAEVSATGSAVVFVDR